MNKKEIKNIIAQGWSDRRKKSEARKKKNNEWTKMWKDRERLIKILKSYEQKSPTLDEISEHRRANYITSPGSES